MPQGTPRGFRDILPGEALQRERIAQAVKMCFAEHGYLPVETPLMEYRDVLERGSALDDTPFQLFDDDELLVMRPDITLAIARMVASRFADGDLPLRLRYEAPVVREESNLRGQPRQLTQLGVELVGEDGAASEREVAGLLAAALDAAGIPDWKIVCGSVVPLNALLDACAPDEKFARRVRAVVHVSNYVALDEVIAKGEATGAISREAARAFRELPRLTGGVEVIDKIDWLLADAGVPEDARGTAELRDLAAGFSDLLADGHLTFDFSIINSFDYYTGLIFKAYVDSVAAPLASGGRYDAVLDKLGRPGVSACGFALSLECLQEVLGEPGATGVVVAQEPAGERPLRIAVPKGARVVVAQEPAGERPLRIAVPKGALFKPTVDLLERAGLPVSDLRNPGRRLIVDAGDVQYVIVRATDAPAFVAYGGADCGICGNDSLVEANVDLLELVNLHYGACHFVVAESASAAGKAERAYSLRVATKYPRITQAYYDRKGVQVDIIQLHGNIELGPIVGMSDRIVDITQTGSTLKQNDLVVVDDDVLECSARFFAGPAAWRCEKRVRSLATRLAALLDQGREDQQ